MILWVHFLTTFFTRVFTSTRCGLFPCVRWFVAYLLRVGVPHSVWKLQTPFFVAVQVSLVRGACTKGAVVGWVIDQGRVLFLVVACIRGARMVQFCVGVT